VGRGADAGVWVPEIVLSAVDLPLRRPSQSDMIGRWR
jgi:hypothetical protein